MKLHNSLTKNKETFVPLNQDKVGIYACGPTVYSYVTIGNWRTYVLGDVVVRALKYLGYKVDYVMNITDVGHLTGDNLGDADTGEDRLEKAAKKENKTAWDIAEFYTQDFLKGYQKLNLSQPLKFTKATEHIPEQIELVSKIETAGFAYTIDDGVYFDVSAYEQAGNSYGVLSTLDQVKEGARVEVNTQKRDPRDFALWKFSHPKGRSFDSNQDDSTTRRQMEWESPWGIGFPGWHIECSAMAMKYLGESFDIHLGGEDLRSTHHPNEIAQAEAGTGTKPFVKYWLHGAFLQVDGGRMGKSLGNAYTLHDLEKKGFDPLALRYFYFNAHYMTPQNFTWEGLESSQKALDNLRSNFIKLKESKDELVTKGDSKQQYLTDFRSALENDFLMPKTLAVGNKLIKDTSLSNQDKVSLLLDFDNVWGFNLEALESASVDKTLKIGEDIPAQVQTLLDKRELSRKNGDFESADALRKQVLDLGYEIIDTADGQQIQVKQ